MSIIIYLFLAVAIQAPNPVALPIHIVLSVVEKLSN